MRARRNKRRPRNRSDLSQPFTINELAVRLGHTSNWLYRRGQLDALYARGMPRPIPQHGHRRWLRAEILRWLNLNFPEAPPPAANDALPVQDPQSSADWHKRLAAAYTR